MKSKSLYINGLEFKAKGYDSVAGLIAKFCYDAYGRNVNDCIIYVLVDGHKSIKVKDPTTIGWGLRVEVDIP